MPPSIRRNYRDTESSVTYFPHPFGGCDDVGETDAELVIDNNHFTLGDQRAIDEDAHRFASHSVKLYH